MSDPDRFTGRPTGLPLLESTFYVTVSDWNEWKSTFFGVFVHVLVPLWRFARRFRLFLTLSISSIEAHAIVSVAFLLSPKGWNRWLLLYIGFFFAHWLALIWTPTDRLLGCGRFKIKKCSFLPCRANSYVSVAKYKHFSKFIISLVPCRYIHIILVCGLVYFRIVDSAILISFFVTQDRFIHYLIVKVHFYSECYFSQATRLQCSCIQISWTGTGFCLHLLPESLPEHDEHVPVWFVFRRTWSSECAACFISCASTASFSVLKNVHINSMKKWQVFGAFIHLWICTCIKNIYKTIMK